MDIVERFFDHDLGISVATQEEYESLLGLLIKLKPSITWAAGQSLYDFDGYVIHKENTCITCDYGLRYGNINNLQVAVISYSEFENYANGQQRLTFEEVLFGTEDEK